MIGLEPSRRPCGVILTQRAADAGLLLSVTADTVIRPVPPLIFTDGATPTRWSPSLAPPGARLSWRSEA